MNIKFLWPMIFSHALLLVLPFSPLTQPSRIRGLPAPEPKYTLQAGGSKSASFSPDGKMLATASWGKKISSDVQIWDMTTGRGKKRLKFPYRACRVAFSPDGKTLAVLGHHGAGFARNTRLIFYKVPLWKAFREVRLQRYNSATMAFSPDSKTLAVGVGWPDEKNSVVLYRVSTGQELATLQSSQPEGWWGAVAFSPDGKYVAAGSSKGNVTWWDTKLKKELHTLSADYGPPRGRRVQALAFSKDGKQLAVGPMDPAITLIDIKAKKVVRWIGSSGSEGVAFSPDGKQLLSNRSRSLCVWSAETGKQLARLPLHRNWMEYMEFSPDGKHLVTCGRDGVAKVWDAKFYEPYLIKKQAPRQHKPKSPPVFPDFRLPKNIGRQTR